MKWLRISLSEADLLRALAPHLALLVNAVSVDFYLNQSPVLYLSSWKRDTSFCLSKDGQRAIKRILLHQV